ncbi:transposable element Tc3 transposase [Trichonephila clavipes]|nr:transposable element Tc3 transposase [Trichonephila clavipes]
MTPNKYPATERKDVTHQKCCVANTMDGTGDYTCGKIATPAPIPKSAVTMGVNNQFRNMILVVRVIKGTPGYASDNPTAPWNCLKTTAPDEWLGKVDSAFHPYCSGSINECQACLETNSWGLTSGLAPDRDICSCTSTSNGYTYAGWVNLAIHPNDHQARRRFVEWAQNEIAVVPDFHKRILFSDEAHFWLNGYVNKQNCRIWSEANPQAYVETPLHPENLTVWCALWAGGIIGPYFKNDEGHNVTVNGDRYRAMITNSFIPELNNRDVQELWFQQDGATCHTARATIDLLKDTLGDRLISHFGPVNCPPRSWDLTPLDYFSWGYVKSMVYADKPQTLDPLEDNIRRVIVDIRPQMLEKVIEN